MKSLGAFRLSLGQTIAWCAGRDLVPDPSSPSNSLRTEELKPQFFVLAESVAERQALVDDLVEKRVKLLRRQGSLRVLPARDLAGGRLLLYDPERNPWDSASFVASFGFFDWDNLPPWDTWVAYVHDEDRESQAQRAGVDPPPFTSFLVSWVPPELIERADAGVRANPPDCALWASDLDIPLARRLEAVGAEDGGWLPNAYRRLAARLSPGRKDG